MHCFIVVANCAWQHIVASRRRRSGNEGGQTCATNLLRVGCLQMNIPHTPCMPACVWAMKMHARNLYESPSKISEAIVCQNVARCTFHAAHTLVQHAVALLPPQLPDRSRQFILQKNLWCYLFCHEADDLCVSSAICTRTEWALALTDPFCVYNAIVMIERVLLCLRSTKLHVCSQTDAAWSMGQTKNDICTNTVVHNGKQTDSQLSRCRVEGIRWATTL